MSKAWVRFRLPGETFARELCGNESVVGGKPAAYPCFLFTSLFPSGNWNVIHPVNGMKAGLHPVLPAWNGPSFSHDEETYTALVEDTVQRIHAGAFEKIVHARFQFFPGAYDPVTVFEKLSDAFPDAFVYLLFSAQHGFWCGATPETLLSGRPGGWKTMALAGTRLAGDNSPWQDKEKKEQEVVADYVRQKLLSQGCGFREHSLRTHITGKIAHLCTDFGIENLDSFEKLALELHPTPAISGFPANAAAQRIHAVENDTRELYTGMIGIMHDKNAGDLFVNLRCMRIFSNGIRLHAGGGINSASNPADEWKETVTKMENILQVIC